MIAFEFIMFRFNWLIANIHHIEMSLNKNKHKKAHNRKDVQLWAGIEQGNFTSLIFPYSWMTSWI